MAERLREAASEEFGSNGYSRARTADIARKAGVSENLLFRHFGSKANLFNAAVFLPIEQHFAEFSERNAGSRESEDREQLSRKYIAEVQDFIRDHADAIRLLIMSQSFEAGEVKGIDKLSGLHRYFENTSQIVRERIDGEPKLDLKLVACISFATIMACELFADWLFPEGWGSEEDIHRTVAEFVLSGFNASLARG